MSGPTRREIVALIVGGAALSAGTLPASAEEARTAGPTTPTFKAPPLTCDTHFHIYDSKYRPDPKASLIPPDALLEDYAKLRARLGIERSVIVQPSTYGTDNSCMLDALSRLGGAARGIAVVDTSVTQEELKRLDAAGVRGIRFNLGRNTGATTVEMIEPLSKRIADLGWHIQMHMLGADIAAHAALFQNLPVITVFDHLGRIPQPGGKDHPAFKVIADLLQRGRAYTKLSSIYQDTAVGPPGYADMAVLARAYLAVAPERVLWASDWPHPSPGKHGKPDDGLLMDLSAEWAGNDATRRKIFVENAAGLYRF
ncbi:amidohydrolase family protein [Rhodoplanes serenus]|jgi:predicted TIM-barrel fold metal-dependent hydrolase|uniref:Amidohydrolase family protein n=1 Tax=Rhodoplanes serenus TaxID=200615 RepID=A0A9X4XQX8_9BRAD|nr:amidohydrolase family protein [Rhodoplanes serenus]MTW19162.1 amidohydrolase family protein [Rhodoplanes serenus]